MFSIILKNYHAFSPKIRVRENPLKRWVIFQLLSLSCRARRQKQRDFLRAGDITDEGRGEEKERVGEIRRHFLCEEKNLYNFAQNLGDFHTTFHFPQWRRGMDKPQKNIER